MKRLTIIYTMLLAGLVLSACTGQTQATPEVRAEDIQATAVAAAFTIVAETQAAIPTNTPLPPTETPSPTPLPTETAIPSPTLDPLVIPTATTAPQTSNTDPCNQLLPSDIQGHPTKIRINNQSGFNKVKVSLYLSKTEFGECGFAYVPILGKNASETLYLVEGTYYIYAWTDDGKLNVSGSGSINNPDLWEFEIRAGNILFNSP
jgi:hypothetical protein